MKTYRIELTKNELERLKKLMAEKKEKERIDEKVITKLYFAEEVA